ncbi:MAG: CRISPR-associated endoribonuclease Cas6 [Halanaerobiales bacterium]|nr:CRISPR-associated endoribonuclease Cas6 [Halanaerobiales bacterium]
MLYSVSVYMTSKTPITFHSYEPESLHGLFFKIFGTIDPALADKLHDGDYKNFTLSSFYPFPKRIGKKTMLEQGKEYKFRVTFLNDLLYRRFMQYFLTMKTELKLNGQPFTVTRILTTDPDDPWCGETDFTSLLNYPALDRVNFKFLTTTSFRMGNQSQLFPLPESLFGSLLYRWQKVDGPTLSLDQKDLSKIQINRYDLKTRMERFKKYSIKGFQGECEYNLADLTMAQRQEVTALAYFSFYAGVGYKTTMGLGQVKLRK